MFLAKTWNPFPKILSKSEYSLAQHLANNLIDMYINLPSKNNYRRPGSYVSKGYRMRRMTMDFAIPECQKCETACRGTCSQAPVGCVEYRLQMLFPSALFPRPC
ncbi:hypothetical protein M405DRAFT_876562 [Rhizopogon salebrosus TDB-379]|nr:hypothetical protein M405DRAFT_876562 [Rhizopogon salebrosus TDB-379]